MSTLVAQTISNGTVSTSSTNVIQGSAKAWVNFTNSGSTSVIASYNVSSVTYVSTGTYTVNMTNAMSNANYAVVTSSGVSGGNGLYMIQNTSTKTTSAFGLIGRNGPSNALTDPGTSYAAVFS
jgi:hypothetical protein